MTEPVHVAEVRSLEPEAVVTFEGFYEAESLTLFRRLWLVTGNRTEAEEIARRAG